MKCHWATAPDGTRYFYFGCMGAAALGHHACTCRPYRPPKEPDPRDTLIKDLEAENARLNRLLNQLLKRSPKISNR